MNKGIWRTMWVRIGLTTALISVTIGATSASAASPNGSADWPMFGQNLANTANGPAQGSIKPQTIANLAVKWVFTTGGDVSARAAAVGGALYFPDWAGNLYKLDASTGAVIWQHQLSDYGLPAGTVARTSPAVDGNTVYLGTQRGAYLLAVDAASGSLLWKTQLDGHRLAIDSSSPAIYNHVAYVGVASLEEAAAIDPSYPCCSFRGSMMAVNATTGAILWKTYMAPPGYTGDSVWGSNPVVDPARNTVFVGTGNNYNTATDTTHAADNHVDSIVALDMSSGHIKWAQRLATSDDWNVACFVAPFTNCPTASGPDFDFGSGPNEFTIQTNHGPETVLGAGQKSGIYSAFNPDTGALKWATQVGPGSSLGGIEWGSATDGTRIYVAIGNFYGIPYSAGNAGSWSALDPATGKMLWQTPDPNGAIDLGPLAVDNGVVFAPSMAGGSTDKNMFAIDAASGNILWSYAAGGSVIAGATVVKNAVYWGSGYDHLGIPGMTANHKFYAFSIGGS